MATRWCYPGYMVATHCPLPPSSSLIHCHNKTTLQPQIELCGTLPSTKSVCHALKCVVDRHFHTFPHTAPTVGLIAIVSSDDIQLSRAVLLYGFTNTFKSNALWCFYMVTTPCITGHSSAPGKHFTNRKVLRYCRGGTSCSSNSSKWQCPVKGYL